MSPSQTIEDVTNGFLPAIKVRPGNPFEVSLPDVNRVAILGEGPGTGGGIIAKGDIGRARVAARLEVAAEEPVIDERTSESDAEALAWRLRC